MVKSNKKKMNNRKQINNKKRESEINKFIKKRWVKIIIHLITIIVWAFFLKDFFVYKSSNAFYSIGISVVALLTFFLELKILK